MLNSILQIFRRSKAPAQLPAVPEGERYYVVGDVHGRLDLFDALRQAIEEDDRASPQASSTVVLLGDLVDRGPQSAGVIAAAREWQGMRPLRCLAGNHEEMFLESFEDKDVLRHFLKHGGRETIMSYGISRKELDALTLGELRDEMKRLIPREHRAFLQSFDDMVIAGDYVFVHAGVDPSRAIDDQSRSDLLWIRERFLRHADPLSHVIVHGHTIFEDIEDRGHRIGIDTGAFRTGVLTALVLDGTQQRYIQAVDTDGTIAIRHTGGIT
ncbi:MAG: serine/threonine protein phosphatase [Alphaproteobacteria bacterium]|nr:serine/threonine protein phosphatase [Alphaproteobacteria bacterium]